MTGDPPAAAGRPARTRRHPADPPLPLVLPPPPALPGGIAPEVSTPCAAPFDAEGWRFSVDWDGARTLVFAGEDGIRLQDERLRDVTALYPEVAAAAASLGERAAVLDGVVTVLDPQGRPDLVALASRRAEPARARSLPAVFLATDLLHLDGSPLMGRPFERRLEALCALPQRAAHLQVPEWVATSGHAFADAAADRGLAAVLARREDAPYRPGVASPDRLRIAVAQRADCVVVGLVVDGHGDAEALLLAEWASGRLVPAGRAAAAAPEPVLRRLVRTAAATRETQPPPGFVAGDGDRVMWMRPDLCVTVGHHGRSADGTVRLASLVALREDRDPAWCVRRDGVAPPEPPRHGGFTPTVLRSLPFDAR